MGVRAEESAVKACGDVRRLPVSALVFPIISGHFAVGDQTVPIQDRTCVWAPILNWQCLEVVGA
jgi:hypothetical protein